jgi:hypothetical protein
MEHRCAEDSKVELILAQLRVILYQNHIDDNHLIFSLASLLSADQIKLLEDLVAKIKQCCTVVNKVIEKEDDEEWKTNTKIQKIIERIKEKNKPPVVIEDKQEDQPLIECCDPGRLTKGQKEFIIQNRIERPSNLTILANSVKNCEATEAGFEYETLLAFVLCDNIRKSRHAKDVSSDSLFPLHKYITLMIATAEERECYSTIVDGKDLMEGCYSVFRIPSRDDFIQYCRLRVPGVGKPSGGSQTIGPDLSMWLKRDVLMVVGSKTSKKLYMSKGKSKKSPSKLLISHDVLDKNNFSTGLDNLGATMNTSEKLMGAHAIFRELVKRQLFECEHPLRLYIRVNSCIPYRVSTVGTRKADEEYKRATDQDVHIYNKTTICNGKEYRYLEMRVNLFNDNYLKTGLFDGLPEVKSILRQVFFDPYDNLQ